jgi:hypothetical protein
MSLLRFSGLLCALFIFVIVFFRLRRHSENRLDVVVLVLFALGMFLVSLFPGLVNLPAEIFSLETHERGRLLTLLILSSVALWFLLIYERGKTRFLSEGFDRLVRTLTVDRFFRSAEPIPNDAVLVIIPAYNEAENLGPVISAIPAAVMGKPVVPLVVDDGSQDNTIMVCSQLGAAAARNLINRGGGAALRAGFDIALAVDARVIVTMDGDGQHRPEDIETLVAPIVRDQADLVIGSRLLGEMERYSTLRYCGVVLFGRMISFLMGRKITDPASGFRAFNPGVLNSCALTQDQYHTAELIIEASKCGLRIMEQPITIRKRISGKSKKGKDFKYAFYFLKTIIRTWMR